MQRWPCAVRGAGRLPIKRRVHRSGNRSDRHERLNSEVLVLINMKRSGFKRLSFEEALAKRKGLRKYGLKRGKRLKPGRKTKEWNAVRRRLKIEHERLGITTCELRNNPEVPHECSYDDFLGFAHEAKRRKLTKED